jgi:hypothetical protein
MVVITILNDKGKTLATARSATERIKWTARKNSRYYFSISSRDGGSEYGEEERVQIEPEEIRILWKVDFCLLR